MEDNRIVRPGLQDGFYFKMMGENEFFPLFGPHYERIFGQDHTFFADESYSQIEKDQLRGLRQRMGNLFKLHIGIFNAQDQFVGWSFGYQSSGESFEMVCSAVLEDYRRIGLYSCLLDLVIELTRDQGFQFISSGHCATNNAVIIPKLKAGFLISKLELTDMFGVTVQLRYFMNPLRVRAMHYRSGFRLPDAELRALLKL